MSNTYMGKKKNPKTNELTTHFKKLGKKKKEEKKIRIRTVK